MKKNAIKDTTLEMASKWGHAEYMKEGLVLTDSINGTSAQEPVRMNFIVMALCSKGTARYTVDTHEQHVNSTPFYHGFVQNVQNVSALLLFSMKNPVVQLTPNEIATFNRYYHFIREKMNDKSHHSRIDLMKALLLAMFYDMSNVIWRIEQNTTELHVRAEEIFSKFIQLLEQNFRSERRVSWYAQQLEITPKYLSETVKMASKRTPNEWIESYVVLELRVLLNNSTLNIKQITEKMNFANQSFLGKYFKEHVGVSPTEFRKGLQPRKVPRTKRHQSDV